MTRSLNTFHLAISKAKELLSCYDMLNEQNDISSLDWLKKVSLILTLTAWKTYIADLITSFTSPNFIRKEDPSKCISLTEELVKTTDVKFDHHILGAA